MQQKKTNLLFEIEMEDFITPPEFKKKKHLAPDTSNTNWKIGLWHQNLTGWCLHIKKINYL